MTSAPTTGRWAPDPSAPAAAPVPPAAPTYHLFRIDSARSFAVFAADLGPEGLALVLKLNRIDIEHARLGDTLIVPDAGVVELTLSPFPREVARLGDVPKLVIVSRRVQAFGAYERGALVRWGPTSTGKRSTPTPLGLFFTNWKAKETISTDDEEWVLKWYFNFHNQRGISFHQYELPGRPASHACVRLLEDDARWLYGWAEQWKLSKDGRVVLAEGTPVLVLEEYAYDDTPPWTRLITDPKATEVAGGVIDEALETHLSIIVERLRAREALVAPSETARPW